MLATIGWIVAEEYHPLFGGEIGGPAFRHFQEIEDIVPQFWEFVVLAIGIAETQRARVIYTGINTLSARLSPVARPFSLARQSSASASMVTRPAVHLFCGLPVWGAAARGAVPLCHPSHCSDAAALLPQDDVMNADYVPGELGFPPPVSSDPLLIAAESGVGSKVDARDLGEQANVIEPPVGPESSKYNFSSLPCEDDHAGAHIMHDSVAVTLYQNPVHI